MKISKIKCLLSLAFFFGVSCQHPKEKPDMPEQQSRTTAKQEVNTAEASVLETSKPSDGFSVPTLRAIWKTNSGDFIVVGDHGTILLKETQKDAWTRIKSPVQNDLLDVFGLDTKEIYIVGTAGTILYSQDNGLSFQQQKSTTKNTLRAIWGSFSKNLYAVGDNGTILSFQGERWKTLPTQTTQNLWAIWGIDDTLIYTAGDNATLLQWQQNTWNTLMLPEIAKTENIKALWGNAKGQIYLAGDQGSVLQSEDKNFTKTKSWQLSPHKGREYFRVQGFSGDKETIYAIGEGDNLLISEKTDWKVLDTHTEKQILDLWQQNNFLYVVGEGETILQSNDSGKTYTKQIIN